MHCDLDLWPLNLKIYRAHPWLMGSLHVKFHEDRCKGKAVMRRKPKCGRTDGRTRWFQYTPPNFVAGGINSGSIRGMHVLPAKHSFGKCDRKVWQTDRQTDGRTTDKVIPMCCYASQATQKRRQKGFPIIVKPKDCPIWYAIFNLHMLQAAE